MEKKLNGVNFARKKPNQTTPHPIDQKPKSPKKFKLSDSFNSNIKRFFNRKNLSFDASNLNSLSLSEYLEELTDPSLNREFSKTPNKANMISVTLKLRTPKLTDKKNSVKLRKTLKSVLDNAQTNTKQPKSPELQLMGTTIYLSPRSGSSKAQPRLKPTPKPTPKHQVLSPAANKVVIKRRKCFRMSKLH